MRDIELPVAFSGPAQFVMYARYGDPRVAGWEHRWLMVWHAQELFPWFPSEFVRLHKHFKPLLEGAFHELTVTGHYREIHSCDCCYQQRAVRGSDSVLSLHSWGAALDMNAVMNPLGSIGCWTEDFLQIMTNNGIYCGQNWTGRKDPMHFAMIDG